jgi:thiamine-phosphate pyrophosphorylase
MDLSLYVITDEMIGLGRSHAYLAEETLKGGASVIQLRDKSKSSRELYEIGLQLRELTKRYDALFIVNDRLDIALALGADGVHIGQGDLPLSSVRRIVGKSMIIGVSVTNPDEAVQAEKQGADYISAQSIFPTSSKDDVGVIGLKGLAEIKLATEVPLIGIGGINALNVEEVMKCQVAGVVMISEIVGTQDVRGKTEEIKRIIKKTLSSP